tara:strand:+ start:18313 stop:18591 length:279 start_codon:yes stop_codon:yes gene_type:complete
MAQKTFSITAPAELIDATISAYAADAFLTEDATDSELRDAAIEQVLAAFREKVLEHQDRLQNEADKKARQARRAATEESMKSQRENITVTIN